MSARDEIRFAVDALRRLPWPVARFVVRARSLARRDGDVFSLDSALRPAKLAVLLEAAAGRRTVVELGTGTAWATIALAIADPERTIESWDPVARPQRERYLDLAGPDVRRRITFVEGLGRGRPRRRQRRRPPLHRQLARARADARRGRDLAPRARSRRARRLRRLRPPGLPGRRRGRGRARRRGRGPRLALPLAAGLSAAHSSRRNASTPPPSTSSTPASASAYAPAPAFAVPFDQARAHEAGVPDVRKVRRSAVMPTIASPAIDDHGRRDAGPARRSRAAAGPRAAPRASSAGPWRSQPVRSSDDCTRAGDLDAQHREERGRERRERSREHRRGGCATRRSGAP